MLAISKTPGLPQVFNARVSLKVLGMSLSWRASAGADLADVGTNPWLRNRLVASGLEPSWPGVKQQTAPVRRSRPLWGRSYETARARLVGSFAIRGFGRLRFLDVGKKGFKGAQRVTMCA
jgi:hypothetical protein